MLNFGNQTKRSIDALGNGETAEKRSLKPQQAFVRKILPRLAANIRRKERFALLKAHLPILKSVPLPPINCDHVRGIDSNYRSSTCM